MSTNESYDLCVYKMKNRTIRLEILVTIFAVGFLLNACGKELRVWTSSDGRTLEAEFVAGTDRNVTLKRKTDGRRFTLPLDEISEEDRKWVEEKLEELNGPEKKEPSGIFVDRLNDTWEKMEYESLKFRFWGGKKLKTNKRYPFVVFLHGKGSGGTDNEKHLFSVPREFTSKNFYKDNPSFIVAPQCPNDAQGWRGEYIDDVIGLVKSAIEHLPVDKNRIYITGVSMGGFGTWEALSNSPDLFAAAVPVCGGASPRIAKKIKDVPIWTHHGVADNVVRVDFTRQIVDALKDVKGNIKYTEYDEDSGIKHDAWKPCYGNPEVFEWMFSQSKENR